MMMMMIIKKKKKKKNYRSGCISRGRISRNGRIRSKWIECFN